MGNSQSQNEEVVKKNQIKFIELIFILDELEQLLLYYVDLLIDDKYPESLPEYNFKQIFDSIPRKYNENKITKHPAIFSQEAKQLLIHNVEFTKLSMKLDEFGPTLFNNIEYFSLDKRKKLYYEIFRELYKMQLLIIKDLYKMYH